MMTTRITLTLDEVVLKKIKELSPNNVSGFVNAHLRKCLFEKKNSMAGAFSGKVSTKDIKRDNDHEL